MANDFSSDIWEYIKFVPYMPRREDRDQLLASDGKRRAIWDYFFRVDFEFIGRNQRKELDALINQPTITRQQHEETLKNIDGDIRNLEARIGQEVQEYNSETRRLGLYGVGLVILAIIMAIAGYFLWDMVDSRELESGPQVAAFFIAVLAAGGAIKYFWDAWQTQRNKGSGVYSITNEIARLKQNREQEIKRFKTYQAQIQAKIAEHEAALNAIRDQIPEPPSDTQVEAWLWEDIARLSAEYREFAGVDSSLDKVQIRLSEDRVIEVGNPLPIINPASIQLSKRIPELYNPDIFMAELDKARQTLQYPKTRDGMLKTMSDDPRLIKYSDKIKHISASRPVVTSDGRVRNILFGVYNMEFIFVADEMMIIFSLFYDFITGKKISERIREVYYSDVVEIALTRDYREIPSLTFENYTAPEEDQPRRIDSNPSENYHSISDLQEIDSVPAFSVIMSSGMSYDVTLFDANIGNWESDVPEPYQEATSEIGLERMSYSKGITTVRALRDALRNNKVRTITA